MERKQNEHFSETPINFLRIELYCFGVLSARDCKCDEGHQSNSKIAMHHQAAFQFGISCIEPFDLLADRDRR